MTAMRDADGLLARIETVCERAPLRQASPALAREIEDLLCEGYAYAHECDAEAQRLRTRRSALADGDVTPTAARELRRVALEERSVASRAGLLRKRLAILRALFVDAGGARATKR